MRQGDRKLSETVLLVSIRMQRTLRLAEREKTPRLAARRILGGISTLRLALQELEAATKQPQR